MVCVCVCVYACVCVCVCFFQQRSHRSTPTDRHTDTLRHRHTDRHTDTDTQTPTDRHTDSPSGVMATRSEREKALKLNEQHQVILAALLREDDNKYCADCEAKGTAHPLTRSPAHLLIRSPSRSVL